MLKHILNIFISFIIIIIVVTLIGGTIFYWLYPLLVKDEHNTNYYLSALGVSFAGTILTYCFYILIFKALLSSIRYSLYKKGLSCLVFVSLLWFVAEGFTYGFNLDGVIHIMLSIGIANFLIPYLDKYLNDLLN